MRAHRPQPLVLENIHPLAPRAPPPPTACSTIMEEEDSDHEPITPSHRLSNGMSIRPRVLRLNSLGDDSDTEADFTVLRFPAPPASLPSQAARTGPKRPINRPPPLRNNTMPPSATKSPERLKSVFEDDSPSDYVFPRPCPGRPAPLTFVQRASQVLKSSSPSKNMFKSATSTLAPTPTVSFSPMDMSGRRSPASKPLPITPFSAAKSESCGNVSPTPSLTSSDSSASSASSSVYLSPNSVFPTSAQDVDDYVDALSAYFPSESWNWDEVSDNRHSSKSHRSKKDRSTSSRRRVDEAPTPASSVSSAPVDAQRSLRSSVSTSELRTKAPHSSANYGRVSPSHPLYLPLSASLSSSSSGSSSSTTRASSPSHPQRPPASAPAHLQRTSSTIASPAFQLPSHPYSSSAQTPLSPRSTPPPASLHVPKSILKTSKSTSALKTPHHPPLPAAQYRPFMRADSPHSHRSSGSSSSTMSAHSDSSHTTMSSGRKSLPQRPSIPAEMLIRAQ